MSALLECPTGCLRSFVPVQAPYPCVQSWKVHSNHLDITLEQRIVRSIEPDNCGIQENVGLSDVASEQVWVMSWFGKVVFESIQRLEEFCDVLVVHGLRCCKSNLVHSVVHGIIYPGVELVDFASQAVR